jgi:hypothetical protein
MKNPHGGARPNSGRPRLQTEATVVHTLRLTPAHVAQLKALGGAAWVRAQLDALKDCLTSS